MASPAAKRALRLLPGARSAYHVVDARRDVHRLTGSGLVDLGWYRRQLGWAGLPAGSVDSEAAAARHYLEQGRAVGLSPCPLFEPEWYDPDGWQAGRDALIRYLQRGAGRRGPHPLFSDAAWTAAHPEAAKHPGRALGHFLAHAVDETPMPLPADQPPVSWGEVRALLERSAARLDDDARRARPRMRRSWDDAAERAFLAGLAGSPLPTAGGAPGSPLVSVITPVRNRPTEVLTAIASVQSQTMVDWELLVVDDGSVDGTPDAVDIVAAADSRVRLLRRPPAGVCAARNAGLAQARGRYVAFLDSDNHWTPDFLRVAVTAMQRDGLRAAYAALEVDNESGRQWLAFEGDLDDLAYGNHVDLNVLVVERDLLAEVGGFDEELRRMVDYDLVLRCQRVSPLALLPFVGAVYRTREEVGPRISTSQSPHWGGVVKNNNLVDWRRRAEGVDRVEGRTSAVVVTDAWADALRATRHLLTHDGGDDVEVVVLANGTRRGPWMILSAAVGLLERVQLRRTARDEGHTLSTDLALGAVTGDVSVLLRADVVVDGPWAGPLRAALADPDVVAVQPLVADRTGVIAHAGLAVLPGTDLMVSALHGHPLDDADRLAETRLAAAGGPMVAFRTADLVRRRGLYPLLGRASALVDASVGLRAAGGPAAHARLVRDLVVRCLPYPTPGGELLAPEPDVVPADAEEVRALRERWGGVASVQEGIPDPWSVVGLPVAHVTPGRPADPDRMLAPIPPGPVVVRPRASFPTPLGNRRRSLRWAIKLAAPAGPVGDRWGDVHFGASMAAALRRLGQDVVVDRREAAYRDKRELDDVVLVLRGLDRVEPQAGATNLLWVISHPDLVADDELAAFDAALAASTSWAVMASERSGVRVEPLLQATDPGLFGPDRADPDTGPEVVFVGNSRGVLRPVVRDAIAAGLPLRVYGAGWEGRIDAAVVAAASVHQRDLGALYRSAGVVLADHWDDMAAHGFVSNRVFDAVAAGARVVSDQVDGLDELFGGAVRTYDSLEGLASAASADGRGKAFPDESERRALAERVRQEHSFDARAARLVEVVGALRADPARRGPAAILGVAE